MKKEVGKLIRIEYNTDTKDLVIAIEIEDEDFKKEILQYKDLQSIISIKGDKLLAEV